VLRAFLGGMKNEALLAEQDEVLVATVRRELKEILGIEAAPEHTQVSRWRRAMAQYAVGHQVRAKRVAEHVAALPGLKLAGNAYDGSVFLIASGWDVWRRKSCWQGNQSASQQVSRSAREEEFRNSLDCSQGTSIGVCQGIVGAEAEACYRYAIADGRHCAE